MAPLALRAAGLHRFNILLCLFALSLARLAFSQQCQLLKDINPGAAQGVHEFLASDFMHFYFIADDGVHGRKLWVSDGTDRGTSMLSDPRESRDFSSVPSRIIDDRGNLFFLREALQATTSGLPRELWTSNGDADGTRLLATFDCLALSNNNPPLYAWNACVWFVTADQGQYKFMKVDAATRQATVLRQSPRYHFSAMSIIGVHERQFLIAIPTAEGNELWRSDGSPAGMAKIADLGAGTPVFNALGTHGGSFYFTVKIDGSLDLWKFDAPGGAAKVINLGKNANGIAVDRATVASVGKWLHFVKYEYSGPTRLWRTDGTAAGSAVIRMDTPSLGFFEYRTIPFKDQLYFIGNTGHYEYLCKNDGVTTAGTVVTQLYNGTPVLPDYVAATRDRMLFAFSGALWQSDGSATGTVNLSIPSLRRNSVVQLPRLSRWLFVKQDEWTLNSIWQTDGNLAGCSQLAQVDGRGLNPAPANFAVCNSKLLFTASDQDHGEELWSQPLPQFYAAARGWPDYD